MHIRNTGATHRNNAICSPVTHATQIRCAPQSNLCLCAHRCTGNTMNHSLGLCPATPRNTLHQHFTAVCRLLVTPQHNSSRTPPTPQSQPLRRFKYRTPQLRTTPEQRLQSQHHTQPFPGSLKTPQLTTPQHLTPHHVLQLTASHSLTPQPFPGALKTPQLTTTTRVPACPR